MNKFLKSIKQKYAQNKNWAKYRFNYMNGIHSYNRQKNMKSRKSIFSKLTKSKLYETENEIIFKSDNSFLKELILNNPSTEHEYILNEVLSNINKIISKEEFEIILTCFEDFVILNNDLSLVENYFKRENKMQNKLTNLMNLLTLQEEIIDSTPRVYTDPDEESDTSNILNKMYDDDLSNTPVTQISDVYNFSNGTIIDQLEVFLEDSLKKYGVKSVDIEYNGIEFYFDLVFNKTEVLTFLMYIDPTGKPVIECRANEGRGSQSYLPLNYSVNFQLEIPNNFMQDFPVDFIEVCIRNFMHNIKPIQENQLGEFSKYPSFQNLDEMRFRKVIRDGVIKWVRTKPKKFRNKKLSMAQKLAIKLAQRKAHTSSAQRHRDKSINISKRLGLYNSKPQYKFWR